MPQAERVLAARHCDEHPFTGCDHLELVDRAADLFAAVVQEAFAADGRGVADVPAGAGGLETLSGFLLTPTKVTSGGADVGAALYEHGRVVEDNLPIAIDAAGKADVAGRITFESE